MSSEAPPSHDGHRIGVDAEFFQAYARSYAAADPAARAELLDAMRRDAVRENRPDFPFNAGVALREQEQPALAREVFTVGLEFGWSRAGSLFELSVLEWQDGRPEQAVTLLRQMEAEGPLSAYQHREFAHRLLLIGDREGARAHLERSLHLEPWNLRECLAYEQLGDYLAEHPREQALARSAKLTESYPAVTSDEILEEVARCLRDKRPYSLIRVNDGEGALLHLGVEDEARWSELYWRSRREFLIAFYFGDDSRLLDPEWLRLGQEFNAAIRTADCLAAHMPWGLQIVYGYGSVRNVPACFNIVRKLERMAAEPGFAPGAVTLADSLVNQEMRRSGGLDRLLSTLGRVAVVSWNPALPDALKRRFGFTEVIHHRTTGEARTVPGSRQESQAEAHARLTAELSSAEPGLLYLVAGGIPGKVYCDLIKRAGGVALDIGAVVDVWMNVSGREYAEDLSGDRLV